MDGERRDDWKRSVDENLASLNAGQRIYEHEIRRLWKAHAEDDKLLRGDKEKETDGMIARQHQQETEINLLRAVVDVDKAGNKGLVGRVEALEGRERRTVEVWKLWVAVVGFIGAIAVAVITNLDKIEAWINRDRKDPVGHMIEHAKHKRGKPIVRYRMVPPEDADAESETP